MLREKENSKSLIDGCHLCIFLLFSQPRWSLVSVVFDFNDLLNGFAPVNPMLPTAHVKRKMKRVNC